MTDVTYEAEFPGMTAEESLEQATNEEIPFSVDWKEISLCRFWESRTARDHEKDQDALEQFREKEWVWVATVKARGHL